MARNTNTPQAANNYTRKVAGNAYIVAAGGNAAIVQFSRGDDGSFEPYPNVDGWNAYLPKNTEVTKKQIRYMPYGAKNDMPNARERLIANNNVVAPLIETKRDIWIGLGLFPYIRRVVDGRVVEEETDMPTDAQEFFDRNDMPQFLRDAFGELAMHGCFAPEAVRATRGDARIKLIEVKKMRHLRSAMKDESGKVYEWYWCGDWMRREFARFPIKPIPLYNAALETEDPWRRQGNFLYPVSISLLTDDYYAIPTWQGSRDWIELANLIPTFHLYNLENGFTPRWHVTIPHDYFRDTTLHPTSSEALKAAEDAEEAARQDFLNTLNQYLSGLKGVGRALVTDEYFEPLTKQYKGIKITPLEVDLKDEALLKLYEKSNQAVIAAQRVHPTLGAIETAQTRAGGSEILRALQLYLITSTKQPRSAVLSFINLVSRINGWGDIVWKFKDETLTTLAENANGVMGENAI